MPLLRCCASGGYSLAHSRSDLVNEGAQRMRVGRANEQKGAEPEVGGQVFQHLHPVVNRTHDLLIGVARRTWGGRGKRTRDGIDAPNGCRGTSGFASSVVNHGAEPGGR
jgi:hypothetical protein